MEEESAGSSCKAENKIFDGKMGVYVLLIRFKELYEVQTVRGDSGGRSCNTRVCRE